jgi:hypothetical protein
MNDQIKLISLKATYEQPADNFAPTEAEQMLEIEIVDGCGGPYFVIKSHRWAFDNIEEMVEILEDFQKRLTLQ